MKAVASSGRMGRMCFTGLGIDINKAMPSLQPFLEVCP